MTKLLHVHYDGKLVGRLQRPDNQLQQVSFTYAGSWLTDNAAFPISTTMPLRVEAYAPAQAYFWFMNLLPEGRALEIVGQILRVSEIDVVALLERMGGDLPGALEIRSETPPAEGPPPRYRPLSEAELAEAIRSLPERPLLAGDDGVQMSLAGAQDKLAIAVRDGEICLPLNGAASTHILKPTPKKLFAAAQNETFCLRLAAAAGLQAAKAEVRRAEDLTYILVERYDRVATNNGSLRRLHQEDLCQATGRPPYLKYEWNPTLQQPGPSLADCFAVMDQMSVPAASRLRLFDAIVFNVLVDNVDAHAKNFSIIITPGGGKSLAPLYDVMCGEVYEGITRNLAMKIADQKRGDHIHGRHWERFGQEIGMAGLKRRVERLARAVPLLTNDVVESIPGSDGERALVRQIADRVRNRCDRMIANLRD